MKLLLLVIQLVNINNVLFLYHLYLSTYNFVGGDNLSVTKGVISRVCMQSYTHSLEYLLIIQIDAAINPGNSGGPVIQGMVLMNLFIILIVFFCMQVNRLLACRFKAKNVLNQLVILYQYQ